jgi:hypothetical protein
MTQRYGVDVSSNNVHPIDWPAVAAYLERLGGEPGFAIVKISQGSGYVNPDAPGDIAAARAAGLTVGGYLMDQGNSSPAAEEATFRAHSEGVPQFDDDELPEGLTAPAYIAHLDGLVAQDPAAPNYLNQSEENEGFPAGGGGLWEANYNGQPGVTHRPGVLIHQYTSTATIPGCAGLFDLNVWLGTETAFAALFHTGPIPIPTTTEANTRMSNLNAPIVKVVPKADRTGYWMIGADGFVGAFGTATEPPSNPLPGMHLTRPIVDGFATVDEQGLILVAADGGVFALGDASPADHGSLPALGIGPAPA